MGSSKRIYYGLISIAVILCVAQLVGAKIAVSMLSSKSEKLVNLQLTQESLDSEQSRLAEAKAEIKKYQPLANILNSIVPQDKNQAETAREIVNLAGESGIELSSITFPKSDLGDPGKNTGTKFNLSQLTPFDGLRGVYQLPITISVSDDNYVSFDQLTGFLSRLEHNRRTAQVTDIALKPNPENTQQLAFTLSIKVYIKP